MVGQPRSQAAVSCLPMGQLAFIGGMFSLDPDFHPAVVGTAFRGLVVGDRPRLPIARRLDSVRRYSAFHQIAAHGFRPSLGEALVEGSGTAGVGMSFDDETLILCVLQ